MKLSKGEGEKKEAQSRKDSASKKDPARSIFPGSRPPSIVDARELNGRVRDGNGWDLSAIITGCANVIYTFKTEQ